MSGLLPQEPLYVARADVLSAGRPARLSVDKDAGRLVSHLVVLKRLLVDRRSLGHSHHCDLAIPAIGTELHVTVHHINV